MDGAERGLRATCENACASGRLPLRSLSVAKPARRPGDRVGLRARDSGRGVLRCRRGRWPWCGGACRPAHHVRSCRATSRASFRTGGRAQRRHPDPESIPRRRRQESFDSRRYGMDSGEARPRSARLAFRNDAGCNAAGMAAGVGLRRSVLPLRHPGTTFERSEEGLIRDLRLVLRDASRSLGLRAFAPSLAVHPHVPQPEAQSSQRGHASRHRWVSRRTRKRRSLHRPFDHHLLDLRDRLGRVETLRASLRAVHDGVAAVEPERVLEVVQALAGRLVA